MKVRWIVFGVFSLLLTALPVMAHQSFAAEYDATKMRGESRTMSFSRGTVMVVDGFHAKDGSNIGSGGHVTLADGKR